MQEVKIYLAPLQGFTDRFYRQAYAKTFEGVDKMFTPYVSYFKGEVKRSTLKDVIPAKENIIPLIPQVLSNEASQILECANLFKELGYDEMNWNLGCPYPMVAKKQKGSGLLAHPDRIREILDEVFNSTPIRLSVKMRLGYEDPNDIQALIPVLNDFPLSEVILHPRIGKQLYKGIANKELYIEHAPKFIHPVTYNGDLSSVEDLKKLEAISPDTNSIMIGRGILQDVFLPAKIKGLAIPDFNDKKDVLRKFHDELIHLYDNHLNGPGHMLTKMNAFWEYFSHHFEDQHKVFKMIKKCSSYQKYPGVAASIFNTKQVKE